MITIEDLENAPEISAPEVNAEGGSKYAVFRLLEPVNPRVLCLMREEVAAAVNDAGNMRVIGVHRESQLVEGSVAHLEAYRFANEI